MFQLSFRKHLSMPGMLSVLRECFGRIPDPVVSRGITQFDCLMSAFAMFSLKIPSLLQFEELICLSENSEQAENLKSLFGVERVPSDSWMRERLDKVDPRDLRSCFTKTFALLQRGKVLEDWTVFDGRCLIAIDGTGYYSSKKVWCKKCCVKNHRNGSTSHYHNVLAAALIHPEKRKVIPFAPELIRNEYCASKNDYERNAAKRLLDDLHREHPHLKAIIVEDALASNGPHINYLKNKNYRFILVAKPGDHQLLFNYFDASKTKRVWEVRDEKTGTVHRFEWDHELPLNDANFGLKVNMMKYEETDKNGQTKRFSWVTDLPLNRNTVMLVMRAGRRRWAIENETFKALKRQDTYNFEHNYGHGKEHLSDVFTMLKMLAFLVDQVQQHCCALFKRARTYQKRNLNLWNKMQRQFLEYRIRDWRSFYLAMSRRMNKPELTDMFPAGP